ncbi:hypothetical protein E4U21_004321 [Claviceps maximensis]|nr:hypothetical protein E4U21_004321 [Claviceps maximensis]
MQFSTSAVLAAVALLAGQTMAGCVLDATSPDMLGAKCANSGGPDGWRCANTGSIVTRVGTGYIVRGGNEAQNFIELGCDGTKRSILCTAGAVISFDMKCQNADNAIWVTDNCPGNQCK